MEGPLDFTGYRYIQFDLQNVGGLATVGLFIESNYQWTEATPIAAVANQKTYTFDLTLPTWKTAASNWQYSVPVNNLGFIQRMGIIFYSTTGANFAYVDNVRKCLSGTPSTSTASPTRSPVVLATATPSPVVLPTTTATTTRSPVVLPTTTATPAPSTSGVRRFPLSGIYCPFTNHFIYRAQVLALCTLVELASARMVVSITTQVPICTI